MNFDHLMLFIVILVIFLFYAHSVGINHGDLTRDDCPVCGPHPFPGIRDEGCLDPKYNCPRR